MDEIRKAAWAVQAKTIIKNLELRNMEGRWCATADEAMAAALYLIETGSSVTWGGSVSFTESGLKAALEAGDYRMLDRTKAVTDDEKRAMWRDRASADWLIMSSNAITEKGELVNIDGNGDRLSLLVHGPEHVLVICGMNKVVPDVASGLARIRAVACPMNAARLHTGTPCEATGFCADCHAAGCMCCQEVITRHSRHAGRIHVILVGESLGF